MYQRWILILDMLANNYIKLHLARLTWRGRYKTI